MKIKEIRLILGDQLNINHSWFTKIDPSVLYVLMEVKTESAYVTHHIQKVVAIFSAMREFASLLKDKGHQIRYVKINDSDNQHDFIKNLTALQQEFSAQIIYYQLPDEYRLDAYFKQAEIPLSPVDSEHFLTKREDLSELFKGKKTFLMETFYRHMRKKHQVLMEQDQPVGGQWNFDQDNRKKLPSNAAIFTTALELTDQTAVYEEIQRAQLKTIGEIVTTEFSWTVTRSAALELLQAFIEHALPLFGTYQDAMTTQHWYLYHSRLSFAMNVKLLSPIEVIRAVEQAYINNPTGYALNQVEGFIRQVLGWREYMRGIYWAKMPEFSKLNYFGNEAQLPTWYWTGETKMNCLYHSIKQSLDHAYAHHIQRLMVTGNFASLLGVHPDEVDRWYLGIYIDAFEWVEITNTRGMSQFADGGIVGSKPYVSSGAYIQKMSNYSCPFNTLYWDFYDRNRSLLERNPRIGMMYKVWDKLEPAQKQLILEKAQEIKQNIEQV